MTKPVTVRRMNAFLWAAISAVLLLPVMVFAQDYHHSDIDVGVGFAASGSSAGAYLSNAPLFDLGYGWRFNKRFQADVGLQVAFGALNNPNPEATNFGFVQGGDHEFIIPLGGRVYIPLPWARFELSAGGGAAYLHYTETAANTGGGYGYGYSSYCYSCTSRGGWGGYGMANLRYWLNDNKNFSIGTTVEYVAGHTSGPPVGGILAVKSTDHWLNIMFQFGVGF
jgi:hypothetical protein